MEEFNNPREAWPVIQSNGAGIHVYTIPYESNPGKMDIKSV